MKKKTKLEIIEETAAAYNSETRAYEGGKCRYETHYGIKCAVGRCMTKAGLEVYGKSLGNVTLLERAAGGEKKFQMILKPSYRGHETHFWLNLQKLHDLRGLWGEGGLNKEGKNRAKVLKEKYKTAPPVKN